MIIVGKKPRKEIIDITSTIRGTIANSNEKILLTLQFVAVHSV